MNTETKQQIEKAIKENAVMLYMKAHLNFLCVDFLHT